MFWWVATQAMSDAEVDFQLPPLHIHCHNAADDAIYTFKNHLIAGLSSLDSNFPVILLCRLMPQVTDTLNCMLRVSSLSQSYK